MAISGLNSPYSGMMAAQTRQNMAANNTANVNTPGFQPQTPAARPTTQTTTAVPAQQTAASPAYINNVGQAGAAQPTASTYAPPRPSAATATPPPAPAQASAAPTAMTRSAPTTAAPQMSNVDMITETANRMNTQNAYGANAAAAQGMNGMMQTLMDMVG